MRRRYRHHSDLIRALGIDYCRGIDSRGVYCDRSTADHREGVAEPGRVHLTDRMQTDRRLYQVLKLAAIAEHPEYLDEPPWRRTYLVNLAVRDLARRARVRVPARYLRYDRRFVLAGVAGVPNTERLRRDAYNWARKVAYE